MRAAMTLVLALGLCVAEAGAAGALPGRSPDPVTAVDELRPGCSEGSLAGCVVSWSGVGALDATLEGSALTDVGLSLVAPDGTTRSLPLDEAGRFQASQLVPGVHGVAVRWRGTEVHRHRVPVVAGDGLALEVRLRDTGSGVDVAVRAVGAGLDGVPAEPVGRWEDDVEVAEFLREVAPPAASPRGLPGGELPRDIPIFDIDDDSSWSTQVEPAAFPDAFERRLMVDPDVNVSRAQECDPMGLADEVLAI